MFTRKTTLVLAFLFSTVAFNLFGYTVTITLNSSAQTINLGAYGSGVTAIHFLCAASASTYYWTIGGDWVSTSGATNGVTSTGSWTVVPVSGMTGCATGEVSVSGTGTSGGGGGGGQRLMPNTTGSFQFIGYISFSSATLSPTNIQQYDGSGPSQFQCTVSGVDSSIPASNYSWSIPSGSSFLTFDPATPGLVYISYPPASSFVNEGNGDWVATGSVSVAITIPNAAQCNITLVSNVRVVDNTAGGPGPSCLGTSQCYFVEDNGDMVEIECGSCVGESIIRNGLSFFPNPAEKEFTVKISNPTSSTTISLFNDSGGLIGTKKGTNENITWDTSGLPSGIYFIKIDDGAKVNTERMLLKK